jgi:hypothetical protein
MALGLKHEVMYAFGGSANDSATVLESPMAHSLIYQCATWN